MSKRIETRDIVAVTLRDLHCNPFEILAELAKSPLVDPTVRRAAASDLAQYVVPKLKPMEIEQKGQEEEIYHPVDLSDYKVLPEPEEVETRVLADSKSPGLVDLLPPIP